MRFHLAQVNVGRFRAPIESPIMEGFKTLLDPINALADRSPGFVWRLQSAEGNATSIRPSDQDPLLAINLSVWESLEALQDFVYKSHHVDTLRARQQWFEPMAGPILALWWIPAGQLPTVDQAMDRLEHLRTHGPTAHAFSFRTPFPPPDERVGVPPLDAAFCDWAAQDVPAARAAATLHAPSVPADAVGLVRSFEARDLVRR